MNVRLGELLIRSKTVSRPTIERALRLQSKLGGRLASNLVALGELDPAQAVYHLCRQLRCVPALPEDLKNIPPEIIEKVDSELASDRLLLPYCYENHRLLVAMADPLDAEAVRAVEFATRCSIEPRCSYEMAILDNIDSSYGLSLGKTYDKARERSSQ